MEKRPKMKNVVPCSPNGSQERPNTAQTDRKFTTRPRTTLGWDIMKQTAKVLELDSPFQISYMQPARQ